MSFYSRFQEDIRTIQQRDPAAKSVLEIMFCYPGLHAVWGHRFSSFLWHRRLFLLARLNSQVVRFLTGVEIHPGAKIGRRVFIDHGMGVVIGETAEVGDDVTLYHGVTLGGVSLKKEKRHPTIESGVVIGAGAKVLGPFTVGSNSKIGANSVVVKEVPAGASVVGIPAYAAKMKGDKAADLQHDNMPDPIANAIKCITDRLMEMEKETKELKDQIAKYEKKL